MFFLSLLSAFVLTRYVRDFASAHGLVAVPTQERHLHSSPLPRLGGVAIFFSFSACMGLAAYWAWNHPRFHATFSLHKMATILVPAALIFLLGVFSVVSVALIVMFLTPFVRWLLSGMTSNVCFSFPATRTVARLSGAPV